MLIWLVLVIVKIGRSGVIFNLLIILIWIGVKIWCNLNIIIGKKSKFRINFEIVLLIFRIYLIVLIKLFEIILVIGIIKKIVKILIINNVIVGVIMILIEFGIILCSYFLIIVNI